MIFDADFWTQIWGDVLSGILSWLPRLVGAILLLLIGWLVGRAVQFLLGGLLRRIGLDKLVERTGVSRILADSRLDPSASNLISQVVYWLVLLVFVIAATESLGLNGVVDTLEGLVSYLPSVLAAGLIMLLGSLLARVMGDTLETIATQAGVVAGSLVGKVIRYVLFVFVGILALEQLGIETTLLITAATAILSATALALAIAFGMGSRDLARNIMAGFHAKDAFFEGQQVQVRGHQGRLATIGVVKSVIETEIGKVSLPNSILTDEEVLILEARELDE